MCQNTIQHNSETNLCSLITQVIAMPDTETNALEDNLLDPSTTVANDGAAPANVKLELKALSRLSAPVIVQLGALYAIIVVNQYFIGHLGAAPLAAAAIGNTVCARNSSAHAILSLSKAWQSSMQTISRSRHSFTR